MRDINTVVSIDSFRERAQQGALKRIEAYWESLRNGRVVPARSEIDPRQISSALGNAFILERISKGLARFRLAGMHLNDLMGMEVRGMPLTAMIAPESRDAVGSALETMFEEPAVARFELVSQGSLGKPRMQAQMVLLPLRSDLGDVSRALGVLVAAGKIGRAPRRFDVLSHTCQTMIGTGDHRCTTNLASDGAERSAGFAEEAVRPGLLERLERADRPHLRLVVSQD
ncbi:PAS domain-containing protein [Rhodobacteraceae bacterium MCCB 386]|nr:PAS domain-containing protein [Roseitranquillus sediminis]